MMKALVSIFLFLTLPVFAEPPAAAPTLKAQLAKTPLSGVVIPEVGFDQASFGDAMDAFNGLVETATKGTLKLQWVYQGVDKEKLKPTVTIAGKKLTAAKLLSEILSQAGLEAQLDEHAIVIRPAKSGAKKPAAPPAAPVPARPQPAVERKSPLEHVNLDSVRLEPGWKKDRYDRTPVKGRNPVKDPE